MKRLTPEFNDYFKILSPLNKWDTCSKRINGGKKVTKNFTYRSDENNSWLEKSELSKWLKKLELKRKPIEFYSTQSINKNDRKSVIDALHSDYLSRGPKTVAFEQEIGNAVIMSG